MTQSSESARAANVAADGSSARSGDNTAWRFVVARAVPALLAAVVITFTADHSASLGFLAFGAFALTSGAVMVARSIARRQESPVALAVSGGVSVLAGGAALALSSLGISVLVSIIAVWGVVTGATELVTGIRRRRHRAEARDWRFAGGITLALAAVVLLVPQGFAQRFTGPDDVDRALTASIIIVGSFGAYVAVLGIFQVIAGLSLKWAPTPIERRRTDVTGNGSTS